MKRTFYTFFILVAIIVLGTSGVKSVENSSTPPTGNTGATGQYCNSCHNGNTLNATGGGITVNGLPGGYTLNTVYTFSITINHAAANRKRWGFAIKAVNANGVAIGTFTTTNPNASAGSGEIRHSNAPTLATAVSTYTYANLKWAAPLTNNLADKKVRFFIVAVAADGTGGTNADFVYSKLVTIPPSTVVKSFTPNKCVSGTTINIKGTSFTGATDVSFGGVAAQSYTVNTDSTISAIVGAGASGNVSVTSPAGTASLAGFTYCAVTPTITNVNLSGCNSLVFNDSTYFTSAIVRDTIRTLNGCDSIYKQINIIIKSISPTTQSINQSACDKFVYKNVTYNSSAVIKDTLRTQEGCDSTYLTINATVNPSVNGRIYHPTKGLINGVKILQTGTVSNTLTASGNYTANCLAANSNVTLKPSKNNDVVKANGVTSIDALLIQRHILNTAKISNAYKLIAADVDGNKTINSVDVLRVKRLILGTDTSFVSSTKGGRLWEFADSAYVFTDTTNPFPFKDSISFNSLTSTKNNQSFIGIKLGDVNYDWNASLAKMATTKNVELVINSEQRLEKNELRIPITVNNFKEIAAMQYTLHFDYSNYEFVGIENNKLGIDFNEKQVIKKGNISMLWIDRNDQEQILEDGSELFTLVLRPLKYGQQRIDAALVLNNEIAEVEAWNINLTKHNIVLIHNANAKNRELKVTEQMIIYPNPSTDIVKVNLFSNSNKTIILELSDVNGNIILRQTEQLQRGNNNLMLNLNNKNSITSGMYFLKTVGLDGNNIQKIHLK